MKRITLSASQARIQFFDLLRSLQSSEQEIVILNEKTNQVLGRLLPPEQQKTDWKKLKKSLQKAKGILTERDIAQIQKVREESKISRFPDW